MVHTPLPRPAAPSLPATEALIDAARGGCGRSLGTLTDRYRRYLLHVARESLSPALRAKVGASDLVQETLLHVQQKFGRFDGSNEAELLNWLRRILYYRALQAARRFGGTSARDLRREISLAELSRSGLAGPIVDPALTPCAGALAGEQAQRLELAIAELCDESRRLVVLRNLERRSFSELGELLACSPAAARKRWVRAISELRRNLVSHGPSSSQER